MTLLLAAVALLVFAIALLFAIVLLDRARSRMLLDFAQAEHDRIADRERWTHTVLETFSFRISEAAQRESVDIAKILDAALAERRQLVTAIVSLSSDPNAARRLGVVEQAHAQATRAETTEQMLARLVADDERDDIPRDSDGNPVQLVGMSAG